MKEWMDKRRNKGREEDDIGRYWEKEKEGKNAETKDVMKKEGMGRGKQ